MQRFVQFTLRLIAWRRRQHTSPSAPVTQPSSLRILIAAVSLLSLLRKIHNAIPSLPCSYQASLESVQIITDDIYFLTYIWPWTSLRLITIRARAALYADLCDLALSSHGLYGGWKTLQRVHEDIQVLREEYQMADDVDMEDGLMSDIKHLRELRSKTKWRMLRSGCELVFACECALPLTWARDTADVVATAYDVLKIQRGEEGVRALTGWIASAINLKLAW